MNTNNTLMQRRHNAVPRGVGQIHPIFAERAENCRVWDVEGREYLDFAGGIAVLNTGHLHPGIVSAVEAQLKKLSHTCFQVLAYEPYLALCERMNQKVPGDFAKKTLLVTTGSEAVENAVKIARAATKRSGAIAFSGAYHGRTHYTLSLTGKVHPYSAGMGLMPGHVYRALYPCPLHNISDDDAIASIERIFKNDAAPEDIAAIIIEPVQGEGGFYAAYPAFMQRLRALCDQHGIMLIADEVQKRRGPDRYAVRHGTDGRCGRYYHVCEIDRRRLSAGRRYRPGRRDGRYRAGRAGRHLRRKPDCLRRRAGGTGHFRAGKFTAKGEYAWQHAARWPDGDSGNAP